MNILSIFAIMNAFYFCQSHILDTENRINEKLFKKSREVENFTTILLDEEAFSIIADAKKHKNRNKIGNKKDKILRGKVLKTNSKRFLGERVKESIKTENSERKPNLMTSVSKKEKRFNKRDELLNRRKLYANTNYSKKKLHKRQFDPQKENLWNYGLNQQRYGYNPNLYNQQYRSVSNPFTTQTTFRNWYEKVTEFSTGTPANSMVEVATVSNSSDTQRNFAQNPLKQLQEDNDYRIYRPDREPKVKVVPSSHGNTSLRTHKFNSKKKPENSFIANDYDKQTNHVLNIYSQHVSTADNKWPSIVSNFNTRTPNQDYKITHSPPTSSYRPKSEKDKLEEQLRADETETDDTNISFDGNCEQVANETCWVTREVGDVLTLSVKIQSSKSPSSFQVKWLKVYHMYGSKKGKPLEIEPDNLPWNMVSGSEQRELRLNPVTNTDIDPNCIVAKVFLLTKQRGKVLFTFMKRLLYRIDIPIIDMGKIYAGEEVSINLENFISLPERANMLFDWNLETKPRELQSLPSNIKVSNSGRSVVLKELKKGRFGVLNCVVYSSSRYSVAKRRFNILKIVDNVKRRSTFPRNEKDKLRAIVRKSLRCRRVIRRSQERAKERFEEGTKPKSRKKRFKRMESYPSKIECEPLRKRMYSRWIRSLFGESTTTDPRLMPLEKLFELSEEGDGTLDDVIPHEVHYVPSNVRVVSGTSGERSVDEISFSHNCTSDADCGNNSICAEPPKQLNNTGQTRYCFCRPYFYGDGYTCQKIPSSNHREKRLRRGAQKDLAVPEHLFYEQARGATTSAGVAAEENEKAERPPKVLAFEEEESFLLSDCIDDKDCSSHASCLQPTNGHPYCKCRPGFRGNGIFCWEIIDYVPPEENSFLEDETYPKGLTNYPEASINQLASKIPPAEELEDEEHVQIE